MPQLIIPDWILGLGAYLVYGCLKTMVRSLVPGRIIKR